MSVHCSELTIDGVFDALGNADRRKLLDSLIADSPPDDAADPGIEVAADIRMYHCHLPKLAAYGLINWDKAASRVTKGPNFAAAAEMLSFLKQPSNGLALEGAV